MLSDSNMESIHIFEPFLITFEQFPTPEMFIWWNQRFKCYNFLQHSEINFMPSKIELNFVTFSDIWYKPWPDCNLQSVSNGWKWNRLFHVQRANHLRSSFISIFVTNRYIKSYKIIFADQIELLDRIVLKLLYHHFWKNLGLE